MRLKLAVTAVLASGLLAFLFPVFHEAGSVSRAADGGPVVIATIPVDGGSFGPVGVAVNPVTNRVYTANGLGSSVSVIDGVANAIEGTVALGSSPLAVAVDSSTNRVYAVGLNSNDVSVIDGDTKTLATTIPTEGLSPSWLDLDQTSKRLYTCNANSHDLSVIDSEINSWLTIVPFAADARPSAVAVNPMTKRIYVANNSTSNFETLCSCITFGTSCPCGNLPPGTSGSVHVVDGDANTQIAAIPAGTGAGAIAVNTATNRIYATLSTWTTSGTSYEIYVIDGASNAVLATIPLTGPPGGLAVNPVTDRIYVADYNDNSVSIIDGGTNVVVASVSGVAQPFFIGVNPATGRIYVTNPSNHTVTVIEDPALPPTATPTPHPVVGSVGGKVLVPPAALADGSSEPSGPPDATIAALATLAGLLALTSSVAGWHAARRRS